MKKQKYRINKEIILHSRNQNVRVTTKIETIEDGIYDIKKALDLAKSNALDLIEINPNAELPVCKIDDYKKFMYSKKMKMKEQAKKNKSKQQKVKELRFGPNTDQHDFSFKLKHAKGFLEDGNKVKAFVFFKGREITFKDKGEVLLLKLAEQLRDYGIVESMPKLEGKRMIMYIKPKNKK